MENLRKLSNRELEEYYDFLYEINNLISTNSHLPLPVSVSNALSTFELKLEKEFTKRQS